MVRLLAKHCPICNRSSDEVRFFGEFCEDCARKLMLESITNPEIEVTQCKRCHRIKVGTEFVEESKLSLDEIAKKSFKGYDVKVMSYNSNSAEIMLVREDGLNAEISSRIKRKFTLCPTCGRKAAGYYEGIVQLRGMPEKINQVISMLSHYLERGDSFIAKIEEEGSGKDVYVESKTLAEAFLKKMHLKYKVSYTLYGMKNGKKLYRHTYSVNV